MKNVENFIFKTETTNMATGRRSSLKQVLENLALYCTDCTYLV